MSPRQLPFQEGQNQHDMHFFWANFPFISPVKQLQNTKKKLNACALASFGNPASAGLRCLRWRRVGPIVNQLDLRQRHGKRKKDSQTHLVISSKHHRIWLPTVIFISRAGREQATDVKGQPQKSNWLVYWCSFKCSTLQMGPDLSISITTFTSGVQAQSASDSLSSQAGDIMRRISNTTPNRYWRWPVCVWACTAGSQVALTPWRSYSQVSLIELSIRGIIRRQVH